MDIVGLIDGARRTHDVTLRYDDRDVVATVASPYGNDAFQLRKAFIDVSKRIATITGGEMNEDALNALPADKRMEFGELVMTFAAKWLPVVYVAPEGGAPMTEDHAWTLAMVKGNADAMFEALSFAAGMEGDDGPEEGDEFPDAGSGASEA